MALLLYGTQRLVLRPGPDCGDTQGRFTLWHAPPMAYTLHPDLRIPLYVFGIYSPALKSQCWKDTKRALLPYAFLLYAQIVECRFYQGPKTTQSGFGICYRACMLLGGAEM